MNFLMEIFISNLAMAWDFSKTLNWLVTLCCSLTKEFSFFTKQSWNPTTKILKLKFPNHGFKNINNHAQIQVNLEFQSIHGILAKLSFSSWTTTASSKKSTVKFVAHSLFTWGALMILKNPTVNILFDNVCRNEQISGV